MNKCVSPVDVPHRKHLALPLAGLALLYVAIAFLVCLPTLHAGLWDEDFIWLYDATTLRSPLDLFVAHRAPFAPHDGLRLSPTELVFFWLGARLHGLDPFVFHCETAVLLGLTAFLIHLWMRALTAGPAAGAVAALTFIVQATHYESTSWLSAVNETILGFTYIGCIAAFASWRATASPVAASLAVLCCLLAFLTKPSAASLPIALLLADVLLLGPRLPLQKRWAHLPFWLIFGAAVWWNSTIYASIGGPALPSIPANLWPSALANTLRYSLSMLVGPRMVNALPPFTANSSSTALGWTLSALIAILYAVTCVALLSVKRHRTEARAVVFHMIWVPLNLLPYALVSPVNEFVPRYMWLASIAFASAVGYLFWLLSPVISHRTVTRVSVVAALAVIWTVQLIYLISWERSNVLPDDTAALRANIASTLHTLAPHGHVYVFQRFPAQHCAGREVALLGALPLTRIRDWYEVLMQPGLANGDVMLFGEEDRRTFVDLTHEVRKALAARRQDVAPPRDETLLRTWDMHDTRDRTQWTPQGIVPSAGTPVYQSQALDGALVSPRLALSPFDVAHFDVTLRVLSGALSDGFPALGWSSPMSDLWGEERTVYRTASMLDGSATTFTLVPASRMSWWTEGGATRFYLFLSQRPARVQIDRLSIQAAAPPR